MTGLGQSGILQGVNRIADPATISGRRMGRARRAAKLTQQEMAAELGCDQTTVSKLEGGKYVNPPLTTIVRYCEIVDLDPLYVIEPYIVHERRLPELVAS